jgi:membrane-associated phospholipid phosphatase
MRTLTAWAGASPQHTRLILGALVLLLALAGVLWSATRRTDLGTTRKKGPYLAFGMLLLGLFLALTWALATPPLRGLDAAVFHAVYRRGGPEVTRVFAVVGAISGSIGSAAVTLLSLAATWARRRDRTLFRFVSVLVGVMGLEMFASAAVARDRPVAGNYGFFIYSYPSGDTLLALTLAALVWEYWLPVARGPWETRLIRCGGLAWPPLVAFARLYMGGHFFTDVMAGALLGGAWICFCRAQLQSDRIARTKAGELIPASDP